MLLNIYFLPLSSIYSLLLISNHYLLYYMTTRSMTSMSQHSSPCHIPCKSIRDITSKCEITITIHAAIISYDHNNLLVLISSINAYPTFYLVATFFKNTFPSCSMSLTKLYWISILFVFAFLSHWIQYLFNLSLHINIFS